MKKKCKKKYQLGAVVGDPDPKILNFLKRLKQFKVVDPGLTEQDFVKLLKEPGKEKELIDAYRKASGAVLPSEAPEGKVIAKYNYNINLEDQTPPDTLYFDDVFREARNQGLKQFEFDGKMYSTEMSETAPKSSNRKTTIPGSKSKETVMMKDLKKNSKGGKLYAKGGMVPGEFEGGEIVETPDGDQTELEGPTHEMGGIDAVFPEGSFVYSDRLTGPDGKTMAQRKKNRDRRLKKTSKLYSKDPIDFINKFSLQRTMQNNMMEELEDMTIMQMAQAVEEYGGENEMATGGKLDPGAFKFKNGGHITAKKAKKILRDGTVHGQPLTEKQKRYFGWVAGGSKKKKYFLGAVLGAVAPLATTIINRIGDKKIPNFMANFGEDALNTQGQAFQGAASARDQVLADNALTANSQLQRLRGSARGVNAMRAMDTAVTSGRMRADQSAQRQYSSDLSRLFSERAGLENQRDRGQMEGARVAFDANEQQRDQFFSNLGLSLGNLSEGMMTLDILKKMKQKGETPSMKDIQGMFDFSDIFK